MRRLRALARLAHAVVHGLHGLAIVLFRFPSLSVAERHERIRWWAKKMFAVLGISFECEGVPVRQASLLVVNHISWLDIMAVHAVVPEARFVSKADVKAWPLVSRLVDAAGTLYLERERKRDALRVVHAVAEALGAGQVVAIFPEGTTSTGHGLLPFHANLLQAAIATATPVQPVALRFADATHAVSEAVEYIGATSLMSSLWRIACGDALRVRLTFLPPRASAGVDRRALAELLRQDIAGALGVAPVLARPALRRDRCRGARGRLGVAQVVAANRLQRRIELVDEGNAVRDVEADDLLVADAVQVLDEGAHAVAVRRDEQPLAARDGRRELLVPERQDARDGVLEALGERDLLGRELRVARIAALAARIVGRERRRRDVVAAPPGEHLCFAELGRGLGLVEALQRAVVALVQAPVVADRQPRAVHLVERVPERPDRALEHRRPGAIELVALLAQQPASRAGLLDAGRREVDIGPAGEPVRQVPGRFAVAKENELVHRREGRRSLRKPRSEQGNGRARAGAKEGRIL